MGWAGDVLGWEGLCSHLLFLIRANGKRGKDGRADESYRSSP